MLQVKNLCKQYKDNTGFIVHLFENISFDIPSKSIVSILAPIGAGKSSLLKIISGLEEKSSGEVVGDINKIVFIPSAPSSFPWLSVRENIMLNLTGASEEEIQDMIKFVGLEGYEDHHPANKSYGFRFRISLARALIRKPNCVILDEPFNEMKSAVKSSIYQLLRECVNTFDVSIVLATTNINEAILLSDKILLVDKNPGRIVESIDVKFPGERKIQLIDSDEFHSIRNGIEHSISKLTSDKLFTFKI